MTSGDGFECRLEVCKGFDTIEPAGCDQRSHAPPSDSTLVMTREQRIFSVQDQRSDQILNIVGVHFDAAVLEEDLQAVEMAGDIAKLLAEAGFC